MWVYPIFWQTHVVCFVKDHSIPGKKYKRRWAGIAGIWSQHLVVIAWRHQGLFDLLLVRQWYKSQSWTISLAVHPHWPTSTHDSCLWDPLLANRALQNSAQRLDGRGCSILKVLGGLDIGEIGMFIYSSYTLRSFNSCDSTILHCNALRIPNGTWVLTLDVLDVLDVLGVLLRPLFLAASFFIVWMYCF